MLTELRILAIHGLLHLLGYDHETDAQDAEDMAAEERRILAVLGWAQDACGLIDAAGNSSSSEDDDGVAAIHTNNYQMDTSSSAGAVVQDTVVQNLAQRKGGRKRDIRLVAIDMVCCVVHAVSMPHTMLPMYIMCILLMCILPYRPPLPPFTPPPRMAHCSTPAAPSSPPL